MSAAPTAPRDVPLEEEDLEVLLAGPPPPLGQRLRGVLLDPTQAFSRHDAGWGWVIPWALVAGAGVLFGLLTLGKVDLAARAAADFERGMEQMPLAQRKQLEGNTEVKDMLETSQKFTAFLGKVALVAGPPLLGLVELVVFGGVAFLAGLVLGPPRGAPELMRGISLAAWASLAELPGWAARAVAVLLGNPAPTTSPLHLVDPFTSPVLAAVLSRLDPVVAYYYLLLGLGLIGSFRLAPRRAWLVVGGLWALVSAQGVGLALLSKLGQVMGGAS